MTRAQTHQLDNIIQAAGRFLSKRVFADTLQEFNERTLAYQHGLGDTTKAQVWEAFERLILAYRSNKR